MAPKRGHSSSSQSASQSSQPRPVKRLKPACPSTSSSQPTAPLPPPQATALTPRLPLQSTPAPPAPLKRNQVKGTLRRLSSGHPSLLASSSTASGSTTSAPAGTTVRPSSTLAGSKIGGRSKDLRDQAQREEMWVRRPQGATRGGLGYAGYLKKGVGAFVDRGCTSLVVCGMGAAIPLALSLALAIRDAIPGGEPPSLGQEGDSADDEDEAEPVVKMDVRIGSKEVRDEVTPEDEDADMHYQTRTKSTVEIELSLAAPLASSLGQGDKPKRDRGGTSVRGRKRRGGKR